MHDAGYPVGLIADTVGRAYNTVKDIVLRHSHWGEIAERPVFARWRAEQQQILEVGARQIAADALVQTQAAMPKASALQAATVYAIMVDKSRLLAGESTVNVDMHVQVQAVDELASILSQAILVNPVDNFPIK